MSILNVENLSHGFGDRAIFDNVSFRMLKGEHIGLVGANGEGKSTFMSVVTGKLMPDEGKIEWAKNVQIGYLDQHSVLEEGTSIRDALKGAYDHLFDMEKRMNEICDLLTTADESVMEELMEELGTIQELLMAHDFYTIDAKIEDVANALGLTDIGLERDVTELSGGQRTKILLAKLLLQKPDILLLDEPTNYLDVEHIEWLKRYLQDYENAFVLISHDIPFLNSVVNIIYHMENQELNRYVGDYNKFLEVYEVKKKQLEAAYNRQQKEREELADFVARNKARVATRNMAMSRQKKLDKMDIIELAAEKPKPEFNFKEARTPGKTIFETTDLVIGYDSPLSKPINVRMERGEKIAMFGANGIGKSKIAREFAMELICEKHTGCGECPACRQFLADAYPDFFYMDAEGKETIGIDRIRENIVNDVSIRPYHGKVKIYIIDEADKMTVGAQNALLKTIEEPPEYVVILLLVRNMSLLLETIRSRCIKLLLSAVSNDRIKRWLVEKGASEDLATVVASYSNGAPGIAKAMAESEDFAGMYNQNVEFLKKISEASINDILLFIGELKKRTGGFKDFINFLRLWYRDICILKLTKKIDNLVFIREESIILRLSREYTLKKINSIIDLIDETETRLNSNVSGDTVMELLFIGLRK